MFFWSQSGKMSILSVLAKAEPIGGPAREAGMLEKQVVLILFAVEARGKAVRGSVDLRTFGCRDINRSSDLS
jgi:hypothetical protein